ncbi:hypothetical protein K0M31_019551 [Melipona bicolor]|uniref:Uncharacterized protein n=1 Tax=Melipona bicolor TaxID=60889 RepID=A0AA40G2M6_9HYME|nr:hypothetical protein K0M31_019551 [Melipona bicolor]
MLDQGEISPRGSAQVSKLEIVNLQQNSTVFKEIPPKLDRKWISLTSFSRNRKYPTQRHKVRVHARPGLDESGAAGTRVVARKVTMDPQGERLATKTWYANPKASFADDAIAAMMQ